jgi:hypothetical protein
MYSTKILAGLLDRWLDEPCPSLELEEEIWACSMGIIASTSRETSEQQLSLQEADTKTTTEIVCENDEQQDIPQEISPPPVWEGPEPTNIIDRFFLGLPALPEPEIPRGLLEIPPRLIEEPVRLEYVEPLRYSFGPDRIRQRAEEIRRLGSALGFTIARRIKGHKGFDKSHKKGSQCNLTVEIVERMLRSTIDCPMCDDEILLMNETECRWLWSIDRIDNKLGHTVGNVRITCMGCNVRRFVVWPPPEIARIMKRCAECESPRCHADMSMSPCDPRKLAWERDRTVEKLRRMVIDRCKENPDGPITVYTCATCGDKLKTLSGINRHQMRGRGCRYESNPATTLVNRPITSGAKCVGGHAEMARTPGKQWGFLLFPEPLVHK